MAGQEPAAVGALEEAKILRVGLARDRKPGLLGELADLGFRQFAEREHEPRQRGRREHGEHVGLVLVRVDRNSQQRPALVVALGGARVVAGSQLLATEPVAEIEHRVEPHMTVAPGAWVRRLAGRVGGDERLDHARAELRPQVEREVR